jgi:hypothetical protein
MSAEEQVEEPKQTKKIAVKEDPLAKKLDALSKKVDALIEKLAPAEKEDADPRDALLKRYADAFRTILADALPKEKLDAMTPEELLIAHDLKTNIKVDSNEVGNNPPKGKTDAKDVSYADEMRKVIFK